jgi:hypothetical protein
MRTLWHPLSFAAAAAVVGVLLYWAVWQNGPVFGGTTPRDYISDFTESLGAGHLYLPQTPDPRLFKLADPWDPAQRAGIGVPNDVSYFNGHYYLYFGLVPFVTLFLPYWKATGQALGAQSAVFLLCALGLWSQVALLWRIARRRFERIGPLTVLLAALALIAGNQVLFLCWHPQIFEVEIAGAYAFTCAALAASVCGWQSERRRYAWFALASGCAGLAAGCRPNCIFGAGALWAVSLGMGWRSAPNRRDRIALVLSLTVPVGLVGGMLLAYNAARFGNPLEFGFRYQLEDVNRKGIGFFSPRYVGFNLREYLWARPRLGRFFPFVLDSADAAIRLPARYEGTQAVYGWLWTVPILWLLPLAGWLRHLRRRPIDDVRAAQVTALAVGAANLLSLCGLNFAMYRYAVDAVPALELAALITVFRCDQWSRSRGIAGWAVRGALGGLLAWTAVINFGASFALYESYRSFNPASFAHDSFDATARIFNQPVFLLDRLLKMEPTMAEVTLKFPTQAFGKVEPLLVTGDYPQQDFLYLYYTDPSHLRIGFESMGWGGPVSAPIPIDYDRAHTIDVLLGSALPPPGHPSYRGRSPSDVAELRRELKIRLDGHVVLTSAKDPHLHATRERWFWGESPFDAAFGTRFTGQFTGLRWVAVAP